MSELTLFLIRLAFLAILWIFVLSAVSVIRSDMFGTRAPATQAAPESREGRGRGRSAAPLRRRAAPTHVLVVSGQDKGQRAELTEQPVLIGRGSDAAIRLEDDYVSTRHARIVERDGQVFVEDLGSTNGTYVGRTRITQPTTLTLGSQVQIGKTTLELKK